VPGLTYTRSVFNSIFYHLEDLLISGSLISDPDYVNPLVVDLISFWEFEEASGTREDAHGSNDLTDNNTVTAAAGKVGNAASFNDDNSEYLSSSSTDFDLTDSFTICGWVWFNNYDTNQTICARYASAGNNRWSLHFNLAQSRIEWQMGANTLANLEEPSAGAWHFYCAWFDDDVDKIYFQIDNGTIVENDVVTPPVSATQDFHLGAKDDNGIALFLDGRIDQWGVWSRVLTASERSTIYNSGNGRNYAFLSVGQTTRGDLNFLSAYPSEDQLRKMVALNDYDSTDPNQMALPVISMERGPFREKGIELGGTNKERTTQIIVSIFPENDIQGDRLVDFVVSGLTRNRIPLYDYSQGYENLPELGTVRINDNFTALAQYVEGANSIFRGSADLIFEVTTFK
jgi:hypothetical protein